MCTELMLAYELPFQNLNHDAFIELNSFNHDQIPLSSFQDRIFTPFNTEETNDFDNDVDSGSQVFSTVNDFNISNHFLQLILVKL